MGRFGSDSKWTFGVPEKKCCICKTMTPNMVGTIYNYGEPNLKEYEITKQIKADFPAAVADYLTQIPNIGTYSNGKRLNLWKLYSPVTKKWNYNVRNTLVQAFGLKSFRENPTYEKFLLRIEAEKDKIRRKYAKERVLYQKTYVCGEACFNLWLLKNVKN